LQLKTELESMKVGAKIASDRDASEVQQQLEGLKIGSEIGFRKQQLAQQARKPPKGEKS